MLTSVATISYTLSAVAHLSLAALLLTSWRSRSHGRMLPIACLLSALWAAVLAYHGADVPPLSLLTDILEIIRNAGWSVFLITLLGLYRQGSLPLVRRVSPVAIAIAALYIARFLLASYPHGDFVFFIPDA